MELLDDDMDELFRSAAGQYPLKTDNDGWDAVMAKLHPGGEVLPEAVMRKSDSRGPLLWLLLLTPLLFIAHVPRPAVQAGKITASVHTVPVMPQQTMPATGDKEKKYTNSIPSQATHTNASTYSFFRKQAGKPETILPERESERVPPGIKTDKPPMAEKESDSGQVTSIPPADTTATVAAGSIWNGLTEDSSIANSEVTKRAATDSSILADSTPVIREKGKSKVRGLYAGVVVSPDLSTVKGQKVEHVGYGAGVIIGYRFSKRLAVETGLLWDRKYYYSEGDYFSTKKIPGSNSSWKIKDVDGWCRMFELPVNVRYFFATGKKSSWYINAGVSSYLMNRENYDYSYLRYGQTATANWTYNNATRNWFNIIHAGIGYERSAGVLGTLRVEPFMKASVGGVGIGSLPLTSFGLNVGITRSVKF